jgi:hypothetical protein
MGITVHYIDNEWKLMAKTLDFCPLLEAHTGKNLYKTFRSVLEEFNLNKKSLAITLDSASNNDSFINQLHQDPTSSFTNFHHVRCLAHVINISAQAALKVINDELDQLRSGIKKIRGSPQSYVRFKEINKTGSIIINLREKTDSRHSNTMELNC